MLFNRLIPSLKIHHQSPLFKTILRMTDYGTMGSSYSERMASSSTDSNIEKDVKFEYKNRTGIILLNKPKALNALSQSMVEQIYPQLKTWESDGKTELVIVKSSTPKAFCAGGDIRVLCENSQKGIRMRREFFLKEYTLNYLTGTYKLPYIAIINGITMGGGCGISVHGPFRVATETTTIAMPETAIGLFPDVGGSHFLPRLPHSLGSFLGLTGHRLRGADVLHVGIATHYIPTARLEQVEDQLIRLPRANFETVKQVLDKNSEPKSSLAPFSLENQLPLIDRLFSLKIKSVEELFQQLKSDGSEFALKQLAILEKMSPTSLKLTFEQLKRGEKLNFKDCLVMEYRLVQNVMAGKDFFEGVRAVLIDKDNKPQWKPDRLEKLSDQDVQAYFEKPSSIDDLQLS